jgi:DNA-binding response OmpR family regulator
LTGQTKQEAKKAALEAGANSFLGKPYKPSSLLALVDTLLARKEVD